MALVWLWLTMSASAGELADLAASDGFPAVAEAIDAMAAEAKNDKKLAKTLAKAGLSELTVPTKPAGGADLSVTVDSPLSACTWADGMRCSIAATGPSGASAEDYRLECATQRGGRLDLPVAEGGASDGVLTWTVTGVKACLALGDVSVRLLPVTHTELDVVSIGSFDSPPELAALKWSQVEEILKGQLDVFQYCATRKDASLSGQVEIGFTLGPKGAVETAVIETTTLDDAEVEGCIVERFKRVHFPPPMGGISKGTYPIRIFQ
ncbi:MAG: energy transducer TonB [Proteobacteria bacterium]|nr:energy transducer TonB [Pseudomonadota bacterium]